MWIIYEHRNTVKKLPCLPQEILKRYEKWKDVARISGPQGLQLIKGFHDEPLQGKWTGHRSSRLNLQYRIIYRIERDEFYIEVVELTAHDYRRK